MMFLEETIKVDQEFIDSLRSELVLSEVEQEYERMRQEMEASRQEYIETHMFA